MQVLQTTKITRNARISLGQDVLETLNADIGDYLQIFRDKQGQVRLAITYYLAGKVLQVLQTTKITRNARISLGQDVLETLNADIGDHLQIFKDKQGQVRLARITPPSLRVTGDGHD